MTTCTATVPTGSREGTEPFRVYTGVTQVCVIAPSLFSIFIAAILHLTGNQVPQGVKMMYRTDRLLNVNRFMAQGCTTTVSITELQYADDNAIVALSEEDLQCTLTAFAKETAWSGHHPKKDSNSSATTKQNQVENCGPLPMPWQPPLI